MASLLTALDNQYRQQNLLVHADFPHDHPVEEVTKLLLAVLLKHLALGPINLSLDKSTNTSNFNRSANELST